MPFPSGAPIATRRGLWHSGGVQPESSQASRRPPPVVAVTAGDPAGVGPELCFRIVREPDLLACCRPVIIGDAAVMQQVAAVLQTDMPDWRVLPPEGLTRALLKEGRRPVLIDCRQLRTPVMPGALNARCGAAAYRYLTLAIDGALAGTFDAIATAPLNKAALHMAGVHEVGHTEILAQATGTARYALMLHSEKLAMVFTTCHAALEAVAGQVTTERVVEVTGLLRDALRRIRGGTEPAIGVLGLNPHAGEGGLLGPQEAAQIVPAIRECRRRGWNVEGPIPPDTAFTSWNLPRFTGYVCHYHDQGHIPFKMLSFHEGVNVTLGLPIIRTSVDHGTAFDIAWQGRANSGSLLAAVRLAARLAAGA